jgi:serine/threonine protein kinase
MVSIANDAINALRRAQGENGGDVDLRYFLSRFPDLDDDELADLIELDARSRLRTGLPVELPRYLDAIPDLAARRVALDAAIEFALRSLSGSRHTKIEAVEALCEAYPDLVPAISAAWFLNDALGSTTGASSLVQPPVELHLPASIGPVIPSGRQRYELRQRVGIGSHGSVYLAVDHALSESDRPAWVAVKITAVFNGSHAIAHRVMEEATKARRVLHPNIARVLDRGPMESGGEFIVYEHVDAGDLQDAFDRGRVPRDPRSLATLVAKIARAVQAAHSAGLIHSDLKPSNILLTSAGEPKVADFGLAARRFDLNADTGGVQLGTLGFIAPERYRAEPGSEGVSSDVYSLGGILYYLLTGKAPNGATADEVAERLGTESASVMLPEIGGDSKPVDPDLSAICRRALAPCPQDRYPSADALANDLEGWLQHRPLSWRSHKPAHLAELFFRRNPVLCVAGVLLVITLLGSTVAFMRMQAMAERRLMRADLDRIKDVSNAQLDANQDINRMTSTVIASLRTGKGEMANNWLPFLTVIESVAGPVVLNPARGGDFAQLWNARVQTTRDAIESARKEGKAEDSEVLLLQIALGLWLLEEGRFGDAHAELDSAARVWSKRNGSGDTVTVYAATLADCADLRRSIESLGGTKPDAETEAKLRGVAQRIDGSLKAVETTRSVRRQALLALTTAYAEEALDDSSLFLKYDKILRPVE